MAESVEKLRHEHYQTREAATQNQRTASRRTLFAKQASDDDQSKSQAGMPGVEKRSYLSGLWVVGHFTGSC